LTGLGNITFAGTHKATAGTDIFQVHGWSNNPLVEYCIIEYYTSVSQFDGGGSKSPLTTPFLRRLNKPSIIGTSNFRQYVSVCKDKPQNGTITIQANFDAWKKAGISLGSMDYQVLSTEGCNNAVGSTNQKLIACGASVKTRAG